MLEIVFTGGPSSGKTSVINRAVEMLKESGYRVIVVPETATDLINSGIKPFGEDGLKPYDFQKLALEYQLTKERVAREAAEVMGKDKTVILYDRGTLDGYAYIEPAEWDELLLDMGLGKRTLLANYNAVLFLENASQFFTLENNAARYESDADEAKKKGDLVLQSYLSHDNLMVIKPREKLEDKQQEVMAIIKNLLGQPVPIKNQRKFLVEDIDLESLGIIANKVDIEQAYIQVEDGYEYRIRKMSQDGNVTYHFNIQRRLPNGKREVVQERVIKKSEYETLLAQGNDEFAPIKKRRYSFVYREQYYRLDVFDDGLVILEVNVTKENPDLEIPDFVSVTREVTDDDSYTNINIARGRETAYAKRKVNSYRGD